MNNDIKFCFITTKIYLYKKTKVDTSKITLLNNDFKKIKVIFKQTWAIL